MSKRQAEPGKTWLRQVELICAERGLLVTPLRKDVMRLLAASDAPVGAYTVLDELSRQQGKAVGPPTAYRALDFLVEHGFAFKIASRNAYVRCEHLGHHHHGALLICTQCGPRE